MGGYFLNPQGQNSYTGQSYAMNPTGYASPEGQAFALAQLQRVLGIAPPVQMSAPTAGPYSWPGMAEVLPEAYAIDGSPLGGNNLGAIAQQYLNNPQAQADAMLRAEMSPKIAASSQPQTTGLTSSPAPKAVTSAGGQSQAATGAGSSPSSLSGTTLPLSFSEDILGKRLSGSAPKGTAPPQVPQRSAFVPPSGSNQGVGMAQLMQVVNMLRQRGVSL